MTQRLKGIPDLPFAPIVSALFGGVAAILVFATPQWLFEYAVVRVGLPSLVPAAMPPLGDTARTLSAVFLGIAAMAGLWPVLRFGERWVRRRRIRLKAERGRGKVFVPVVADETDHTDDLDSLPRRPLFAERDLGAPLMSDEALASADELLLDPAWGAEDVVSEAWPEEPAPEAYEPDPVAAIPRPVSIEESAPVAASGRPMPETVPVLLNRLESALQRRSESGDTHTFSPDPKSVAELQSALGVFTRKAS